MNEEGKGKSNPKPGALGGVRIVDLTQYILGPYATQILADLGADVIKIEEPTGDRQRITGGKAPNSKTMGPVYVAFNRNKRSVALDLKSSDGRKTLQDLVRTADIFIHNMRPEAMKRLGFDYGAAKSLKPDIIYIEAVGYAPGGVYEGLQAFDDLIQAASGACGLAPMVDADQPLRPLPSYLADKTSGLFATIAALAALRHRERTGEGQYVCVPMAECFTGFLMAEHLYGETYIPPSGRFGHTMILTPDRRPRKTKDGYLAVAPANRAQTAVFLDLGGIPDAFESERFLAHKDSTGRVAEFHAMMDEAAATRTTAQWLELCREHSIPAMRANMAHDILDDPHFAATLFEERDLPGEGRYRAFRPGLRLEKTPASIRTDPPTIGQHTDEVLSELGKARAGKTADFEEARRDDPKTP